MNDCRKRNLTLSNFPTLHKIFILYYMLYFYGIDVHAEKYGKKFKKNDVKNLLFVLTEQKDIQFVTYGKKFSSKKQK